MHNYEYTNIYSIDFCCKEFVTSVKDSSLKKTGSLLKKLKLVTPDQVDSIVSEMKQTDLSRYVGELCSCILENKPKNSDEFFGIVRVTVSAIEDQPGFKQAFLTELWKRITEDVKDLDPTNKSTYTKFRWMFRLAVELHVLKAYSGLPRINSVFGKLVRFVRFSCLYPYFLLALSRGFQVVSIYSFCHVCFEEL